MVTAASLPTAPQWARSAYEAAISSLGEPKRMAWVAVHSGELVGFAIVRLLAPESELESIAIRADAQGCGFGSSLLSTILQELKLARPETGVGQVDLEVRASANEAALGLYRQAGFLRGLAVVAATMLIPLRMRFFCGSIRQSERCAPGFVPERQASRDGVHLRPGYPQFGAGSNPSRLAGQP